MVLQHLPSSLQSKQILENAADSVVCQCHEVKESAVRDAIIKNQAETVAEVTLSTCAGGSCQACHCKIKRMLKGGRPVAESAIGFCNTCNSIASICVCTAA